MSSVESGGQRMSVFAGAAGLLFGLGLSVSRMTDPNKVLNFLDVFGAWDPSLALVIIGALAVSVPGFTWVRRRGRAVCGALQLPSNPNVDRDLLLGAALFGIGWGLAGYCPGPALAGMTRGSLELLLFVPAMLLGFWLGDRWATRG
jgi:hypothetical protein